MSGRGQKRPVFLDMVEVGGSMGESAVAVRPNASGRAFSTEARRGKTAKAVLSNPPGPTIKKAPLWRGFFNGGLGWVRAPLRFDQMRVVALAIL